MKAVFWSSVLSSYKKQKKKCFLFIEKILLISTVRQCFSTKWKCTSIDMNSTYFHITMMVLLWWLHGFWSNLVWWEVFCPWQGVGTRWCLKVPYNLNCSVIYEKSFSEIGTASSGYSSMSSLGCFYRPEGKTGSSGAITLRVRRFVFSVLLLGHLGLAGLHVPLCHIPQDRWWWRQVVPSLS